MFQVGVHLVSQGHLILFSSGLDEVASAASRPVYGYKTHHIYKGTAPGISPGFRRVWCFNLTFQFSERVGDNSDDIVMVMQGSRVCS
jgi:hypothetical protein